MDGDRISSFTAIRIPKFPEAYDYLAVMNHALERWGFPWGFFAITVVRYVPSDFKHWPPYYTLEENCSGKGETARRIEVLASHRKGHNKKER